MTEDDLKVAKTPRSSQSVNKVPDLPLVAWHQVGLETPINVLLAMYNEQCTQARHYESQWATISGFIVAISGALIALMTYDQKVTHSDVPAAAYICVLGIFGVILTLKYYQRSHRHGKRAQKYREKLDELFPDININKLREESDEEEKKKFPRVQKLKLHHIWYYLHVAIALLGVLLIAFAWFKPTG